MAIKGEFLFDFAKGVFECHVSFLGASTSSRLILVKQI